MHTINVCLWPRYTARNVRAACGLSVCTLFHKLYNIRQNIIEHKMCALIFYKILSETFLILRRKERNMIKNVYCSYFNLLNPELNPICYLLALLGAHHFLHVSRIRVKLLTLRLLMSYIHGAPILDVSRSHTTTQHSR